jgi:hypothetical protein
MTRILTLVSLVGALTAVAAKQWGVRRYAQSEDDRLAEIIRRYSPALMQARGVQ